MTLHSPSMPSTTSPDKTTDDSMTGWSTSGPHELECMIQRRLTAQAGLKFSRLTVHKCPSGVCLEGSLETNADDVDLCELVKQIAGIEAINHVVMQPASAK